MAIVTLPLLSQVVRGKLGDVVFFRRGDFGINVARIRVKPQNPNTANQQAVRHNLGTLSDIWQSGEAAGKTLYKYDSATSSWVAITIDSTETFTDTEKNAWKNYSTTSNKGYQLTGRLAFISVNLTRLKAGQNPLKDPLTEFTIST